MSRLANITTRRSAACLFLAVVAMFASGCMDDNQLVTEYGSSGSMYGHSSVNGLGIFKEMFQVAGHETATATYLSPRAQELADVIVWAPSDFNAPAQDAVDWLDAWLAAKPGRTLIYIHRDYDAAPAYWKEVRPTVPASLLPVVQPQINSANSNYTSGRVGLPATGMEDYSWFSASGANNPRIITTLQGDTEWTSAIDASKLEIELTGGVQPKSTGRTVLASAAGDPLIIEQRQRNSKVIVLANGSFVLNYPLINPEHRKLAGKVVDSVGDDKYVMFLDSSSSPSVLEEDPVTRTPTPFDFLNVEPINYVLLHLILFGLILCFARYPIFGIPRDDAPENLSDFGEHLEALGRLLAKTGQTAYAVERLQAYRKLVRGDHASSRNLNYAKEDPADALLKPEETPAASNTAAETIWPTENPGGPTNPPEPDAERE